MDERTRITASPPLYILRLVSFPRHYYFFMKEHHLMEVKSNVECWHNGLTSFKKYIVMVWHWISYHVQLSMNDGCFFSGKRLCPAGDSQREAVQRLEVLPVLPQILKSVTNNIGCDGGNLAIPVYKLPCKDQAVKMRFEN